MRVEWPVLPGKRVEIMLGITFLAGCSLVALPLRAEDGMTIRRLRLGPDEFLELPTPSHWLERLKPEGPMPPTWELEPGAGDSSSIQITAFFTAELREFPRDMPGLRKFVEVEVEKQIAGKPVEADVPVLELTGENAAGFYYSITDKTLEGKVTAPDDFRYMTRAWMTAGPLVLSITILTNEPEPGARGRFVEWLRGFRYVSPGEKRRMEAAPGAARILRHKDWGVEVRVPGYVAWDDNPNNPNPKQIFAAISRGVCEVYLTVWGELISEGSSAADCRLGYAGSPERIRKMKDTVVHEVAQEPITFSRFDYHLRKPERIINNQLYGYWIRDDICFELHVSSIDCDSFTEAAMPILESFKVLEHPGTTLETIALALSRREDPRASSTYLSAANEMRAGNSRTDSPRGRRLLQKALERPDAPAEDWMRQMIESRIGLALLAEGKPADALPTLSRALEAAASGGPAAPVNARLNLAMALAATGDTASACALAKEAFLSMPPTSHSERIAALKEDDLARDLSRADCYKALVRDIRRLK